VRVANTVLNVVDCTASEPVPSGLALPDGFEAAEARRCTRSVLGIVHDWELVVREKATAGEDPKDRRQIRLAADRIGHPVQVFYLDNLMLLLLAAYLFVLERRFGATLVKHTIGIQVRSLGGAPLGIVQAGKRILPRLIVLLSASATDSILGSSTETHRILLSLVTSRSIADFGLWSDVLNFMALAYLISFVVATSRRTLPLHDRWADTEAVRPIAPPSGSCASWTSYHCFVTDTRIDRGSSGWKWISLATGPAG
jgi:uncharacterized RDD family membrane protein YckC